MTRAFHLLRRLRTLFYWAMSPLERLLLSAPERRELPPLWLRRHVGAPAKFQSAARETAEVIDRLGLLAPGATVLDVGCGCGAMVPFVLRRLSEEGRYVGFDVHGPSIRWCRRRWQEEPRVVFYQAEILSPYATGAARAPVSSYRFPVPDRSVGFVLVKSVFTHMLGDELAHYLTELERVLAPGGQALVSFFHFDGASERPPPAFPFPSDPSAVIRWRRWGWRHAAVAYARSHSLELIESAGLEVVLTIDGFWPGAGSQIEGQDLLLLRSSRVDRAAIPPAELAAGIGALAAARSGSSGSIPGGIHSPPEIAAVRHFDPPGSDR